MLMETMCKVLADKLHKCLPVLMGSLQYYTKFDNKGSPKLI